MPGEVSSEAWGKNPGVEAYYYVGRARRRGKAIAVMEYISNDPCFGSDYIETLIVNKDVIVGEAKEGYQKVDLNKIEPIFRTISYTELQEREIYDLGDYYIYKLHRWNHDFSSTIFYIAPKPGKTVTVYAKIIDEHRSCGPDGGSYSYEREMRKTVTG